MKPLVAAICRAPLLAEGVAAAVEDVMTVRTFSAGGGDTRGLLEALAPDGVVVDCDEQAAKAASFASERSLPLVHVLHAERSLRVLAGGRWEDAGSASADGVRAAMVGGIFGKGRRS